MGKTILIVDDDRVIQDSLQELFRDAGYAVFLAGDGVSGFEAVARERPDAVVADILLPRMHGIALCEKIRASDTLRQTPIVLMTGVYKDVNLRMYVHKGLADDFIEKPFKGADLKAKVERLIGQGPPKAESQAQPLPAEASGRSQKGRSDQGISRDLEDLIGWARGKEKK